MAFNFHIPAGEIKRALAKVDKVISKIETQSTTKALRKAVRPLATQVKANLKSAGFQDSSGALRRSIGSLTSKRGGVAIVGARTDARWYKEHNGQIRKPASYVATQEGGSAKGVEGKRFLQQAYLAKIDESMNIFYKEMGSEFDKGFDKARASGRV